MVDHQHHHLAAQHLGPSPLDTLAHTSQYAALQYHQNRHVLPNGKAMAKPHRLPYASGPIAPRNQREMVQYDEELVELVINATNCGPSAMADNL
jgi:hypothetical protein